METAKHAYVKLLLPSMYYCLDIEQPEKDGGVFVATIGGLLVDTHIYY